MSYYLLALLFFVAVAQAQTASELCANNCTGGVEDNLFTLSNYGSWGLPYVRDPNFPVIQAQHSAAITTAMIVVHGEEEDAYDYYCYGKYTVQLAGAEDSTFVIAPHFLTSGDAVLPSGWFYWIDSDAWEQGGKSDMATSRIPSFQILDDILKTFSNTSYFPGMQQIVLLGHSAGAQAFQRYAIATSIESSLSVPVRYIIENPGSYAYLETSRAILPTILPPTCNYCNATQILSTTFEFEVISHALDQNCTTYNNWKMGLDDGNVYLDVRDEATIRAGYATKDITYVLGTADTCSTFYGDCGCDDNDLDTTCAAQWQGFCRLHRGAIWYQYLNYVYGHQVHKLVFVPNVGHDACPMFTANESILAIYPNGPLINPLTSSSSIASSSTASATVGGATSSGSATTGPSTVTYTATITFTGSCSDFDINDFTSALSVVDATASENSCKVTGTQATVVVIITLPSAVAAEITTSELEQTITAELQNDGYAGVTAKVQQGSPSNSGSMVTYSIAVLLLALLATL